MTKTAPQRRSQIARVLTFFRSGHPDEVRAVFHILMEEGLIPAPPKERQRRKRRLNMAENNLPAPETNLSRETHA